MNFDYKKTKKWLLEHDACDYCLGRQFHGLFIGDNALIGSAVRKADNAEQAKKLIGKEKPKHLECDLCGGLLLKTDEATDKAFELIQNFEFSSFLVGARVPKELVAKEEEMWSEIGAAHCEPLKKDLKRQIGLKLEEKTGKKVDFEDPDLSLLVDFTQEPMKINIDLNSLFVYGEYRKLVRGIPQTRWYCRECRGKGCEHCGFTGKAHEESVEELVAPSIKEFAGGRKEKFHGAGREDIDAKMLGWRPFTVEILKPIRRNLDFGAVEKKLNTENKGKVEVRKLRLSDKKEMRLLKTIKLDKTYQLEVTCEKPFDEKTLSEITEEFTELMISQRTPTRVAERRADKVRKRKVKSVECKKKTEKTFNAIVKAESGTYVKELVSGDEGRTKPSFAEYVGPCKVTKLDVVKVHRGMLK